MATQKEIAQFFQLALRLRLIATTAVEHWANSITSAERVIRFPFTDLAIASHLSRTNVDELLGQVTGHSDPHVAARVVLALLRRRFCTGEVALERAIKHARDIAFAIPLTEKEYYESNRLDDALSLATSGTYGTLDNVRREVAQFLENYQPFDDHIPATV